MKKIMFIFIAAIFVAIIVQAQNVKPAYQYLKLPPGQGVFEIQSFGAPIAALTTRVVSGTAGNIATGAVTLSTFTLQPDVPRNLTITPGGTTADVGTCVIVVNGTDFKNHAISENFSFAANASTATVGAKAFKSVTSVVFPANCEDSPFGATWSIGVGELIGIGKCMDEAAAWSHSSLSGAKEATAASITASANTLSLNTADFNGTMNGSNTFKGYYIQNFHCY